MNEIQLGYCIQIVMSTFQNSRKVLWGKMIWPKNRAFYSPIFKNTELAAPKFSQSLKASGLHWLSFYVCTPNFDTHKIGKGVGRGKDL